MSLCLVRIDDRLIHGQVVIGWGGYLHPDRIILCSDEVASSEWEREIYLGAVGDDIEANVLSVEETAQSLLKNEFKNAKLILLVELPKTLLELLDYGVEFTTVNVGGMHYKESKRCVISYIYVDDQDVRWFKELYRRHIKLECQNVPTSKKLDLARLLHFEESD